MLFRDVKINETKKLIIIKITKGLPLKIQNCDRNITDRSTGGLRGQQCPNLDNGK